MKVAVVLLFLVVLASLPQEGKGWGWVKKQIKKAKDWVKKKWDDLKQKLREKLGQGKRDTEVTDDDVYEALATRDVMSMFEQGELSAEEEGALRDMQRHVRSSIFDDESEDDQ